VSETWYEVKDLWSSDVNEWIKPITVVKETEHTVTVEEKYGDKIRLARRNKGQELCPTKFEAEAEITRRLRRNIDRAQESLDQAKKKFEKWFCRS
jgi:hypothetical protein